MPRPAQYHLTPLPGGAWETVECLAAVIRSHATVPTVILDIAAVLLVFVLVKSVRLLRARAFPWRDPRAWSVAAAVCLGITFFAYTFGALSGFTQTSEVCAVKSGHGSGNRPDSVTETAFPPSYECRWNDGTTIDLVPAWVNPVVFVFATGFVLCSAKAVHAAVTSRAVTSRTGASS